MTRWIRSQVTRSNAGGVLYNAVNIETGEECDEGPSHDCEAIDRRVARLNGEEPRAHRVMLTYSQKWSIAPGDPTRVVVPHVAKPMQTGSADRARLIVRAGNCHGDFMAFLRKVRDNVRTMERVEDRADLAELAGLLLKASAEQVPPIS